MQKYLDEILNNLSFFLGQSKAIQQIQLPTNKKPDKLIIPDSLSAKRASEGFQDDWVLFGGQSHHRNEEAPLRAQAFRAADTRPSEPQLFRWPKITEDTIYKGLSLNTQDSSRLCRWLVMFSFDGGFLWRKHRPTVAA